MAKLTPSKQLNDLLISKDFDPQLLNREGKPAQSPEDADVFSFDYVGTTGKDYGTVAILMGDDNNMDVYFGDNLGKGMDPEDKKGWFDFLYQLRQFAKRNLQSFGIADLNKLKYSMKGQAAIKEGLFESWRGTSTQSWTRYPNDVKLIIRHSRPLSENDKRYRYIQSLFLETAEGERFKLPFTKLSGGRAMVQHVRQGGNPYDIRGQHICEMVKNINVLSQFRRASRNQIFEGEAATLLETATKFYESIKKNLYSLISPTGYTKYFESWKPEDINKEDLIIEDIKNLFVTQTIDTRIENALPLLAKLQQENNMKELSIFEGYLNCITEGTWSLPDTEQKQQELIRLLADEFPVGPDATNATEQLYDILGNDSLFDQLQDLAKEDANADARVIIIDFLERMKHDKNVAQVIGKLNVETAGEPVETEKAAKNNSSNQEQGQIEEDAESKDDRKFIDYVFSFYGPGGLYDMGATREDIAAATKIYKKESDIFFDGDSVDRENVRDKLINDFGYEWVDEGIKGAIAGGLAGAALTKTPSGAITGARIGNKLGDMMSENLTWEPKTKAGEVTDEFFGEMTKDELFASDLARMKSLAMIK